MTEPEIPSSQPPIRWRVHLRSPPERAWAMLDVASNRERFWAHRAPEVDGAIEFTFHGGERLRAEILERRAGERLALRYFGGSTVAFDLAADGAGGTDLTLTETDCPAEEYLENLPGWVSVLLGLKAAVDHGIDLRNADPARSWGNRYVDV